MNMTRREAVIRMALMMGASVVGPRLLAKTFGSEKESAALFSPANIALLDEIGETIIPATKIPGAKAVGIGAFIAMMVTDCYVSRDQEGFKAGLAQLAADYEKRFSEKFISGKPENRTTFLNELDREQRKYTSTNKRVTESYETGAVPDRPPAHYFRMMRELTILGYFSSEIGSTQALRYLEVPGRYDGDVPYKKGDEWFI
ncbi:gluconate 2-dehydrogenase subunit 3 family protein [Oleiharenicola lentus]|uniref:gluconate 2-dehydrogenase subunit 3 family protein n=1 Tax=Oleiharenicola lentus TaxID=2508720 RepID=UPI003F670394